MLPVSQPQQDDDDRGRGSHRIHLALDTRQEAQPVDAMPRVRAPNLVSDPLVRVAKVLPVESAAKCRQNHDNKSHNDLGPAHHTGLHRGTL